MTTTLTQQNVEETIKEMLAHAVHFGHRSFKWNPKMLPFLYGKKNGVHIIDLRESLKGLYRAQDFISTQVAEGKTILLVSTKPQATKFVKEAAQESGMPYVIKKWLGGLLTNFATIKKRTQYLQRLQEEEKKEKFEKYTKKEAMNLRKTIKKLQDSLGGVASLTKLPDMLFVADAVKDKIAVKEARKVKIPVIAIVDSNADPTLIDYPIPGNDDAVKSHEYLIKKISQAILEGIKQKDKKAPKATDREIKPLKVQTLQTTGSILTSTEAV